MAIFTFMTEDQKIILGADKNMIKASRLKAPLVIVTCGGGMLVALTITFIKGVTSSFQIDGFSDIGLYIYAVICIISAIGQLKFINLSMEIYD